MIGWGARAQCKAQHNKRLSGREFLAPAFSGVQALGPSYLALLSNPTLAQMALFFMCVLVIVSQVLAEKAPEKDLMDAVGSYTVVAAQALSGWGAQSSHPVGGDYPTPTSTTNASSERALAAARSLINTQTSWTNDPGCTGGTYAFDSGTGSCYAYSCAPAFGSTRIVSSTPCSCINSNDCFYAWRSNAGDTATSQFKCSGANLVTNTLGTCVYGPAVPKIVFSGVSQTPASGCPAQNLQGV